MNKEHLNAIQKSTLETAVNLMQISINNLERLTALNLKASKKLVDEATSLITSMASANNAADWFEALIKVMIDTSDKNIKMYQELSAQLSETHANTCYVSEKHVHAIEHNFRKAFSYIKQLNNLSFPTNANLMKQFTDSYNKTLAMFGTKPRG